MTVDQSTQDKPANGSESAPASAPATKLRVPEYRRRTHLTMTVHPDTLSRLKVLTDRYRLPVGQIVQQAGGRACSDARRRREASGDGLH